MLTWMLYVMTVTLLLSGAAYAAERNARLRRASTRWIWAVTIVASLLLPTVIASVSIQIPSIFSPVVSQELVALRAATSEHLSYASWGQYDSSRVAEIRKLDPVLKRAWVATSAALLLALAATGVNLIMRKRTWSKGTVNGKDVYVTPNIGPAVVGLISPRIVVPQWVLESSPLQQTIVLAHEQSHIDSGDPQLLTVALCLLVIMPWNIPLWWQFRRLRYAIEVDCDARVLRGGQDVREYGETLIEVGQRQSAFIGSVAAMSESKSFLEERIKIMLLKPKKWGQVAAIVMACLSIGMATVAAQVGPPNATSLSSAERQQVAIDANLLDGYVGTYKLGPAVMHITREGSNLLSRLTGQRVVDVFPESEKTFFAKVVNAQISFDTDAQGRATSLTLHQNGKNIVAPRIDPAAAQQIEDAITAKVHNQLPTAGSEAALRRHIEAMSAGKPNYSELSPELADAAKKQLTAIQTMLSNLGPVQSIAFNGVGNQGWDNFTVRHSNGVAQWRILVGANGILEAAFFNLGP